MEVALTIDKVLSINRNIAERKKFMPTMKGDAKVKIKKLLSVLIGGALLAGMSITGAHAVPFMQISDGTRTLTIADNDANDQNSMVGGIAFSNFGLPSGLFTGWMISVNNGVTSPLIGTYAAPVMHLSTSDISSALGTLTVKFTETAFTYPEVPTLTSTASATLGGSGSTATMQLYMGEGAFSTTNLLVDHGIFSGAGGINSKTFDLDPLTNPYSLTQIATLTHRGTGGSSIDWNVQPIPEPGTILLLGGGLLGLAFVARRKQS